MNNTSILEILSGSVNFIYIFEFVVGCVCLYNYKKIYILIQNLFNLYQYRNISLIKNFTEFKNKQNVIFNLCDHNFKIMPYKQTWYFTYKFDLNYTQEVINLINEVQENKNKKTHLQNKYLKDVNCPEHLWNKLKNELYDYKTGQSIKFGMHCVKNKKCKYIYIQFSTSILDMIDFE
jgi:hypothetical protein